jgi:uncharacterized protein YhaN
MRIQKMTATFGRLEGKTLTLNPGLNLITAPNEAGKTTWCAFLRAMLYGIPTRERDTKTALAEKNRWQPWSGAPMAGEMELIWQGQAITLRRFRRGASPFGGFEAVDTRTGQPAPGLTAENAGEVLLGVSREVFQRSAFVGQSGLTVDGSGELEKRIAALVSSGEEDVACSQVESTLKSWLRRRKYNKGGRIPELEEELSTLDSDLSRLEQADRQAEEDRRASQDLTTRKAALEQEAATQQARIGWARHTQYQKAVDELEQAQRTLSALEQEAGPIPGKEALRRAQGELAYLNTLDADRKQAGQAQSDAEEKAGSARAAADDPLFRDLSADDAWKKASRDTQQAKLLLQKSTSSAGPLIGALAGVAFGVAIGFALMPYWGLPILAALALLGLVAGLAPMLMKRTGYEKELAALLAKYGAGHPDDITARADAYRTRCMAADNAQRNAAAAASARKDMQAKRDQTWTELLNFVHGFAPAVTDLFGVSAALSRALSMEERLANARMAVESAQKLVSRLPYPGEGAGDLPTPPPPTARNPQQTAAALSAVSGELTRLNEQLALARGRRVFLGDRTELLARRGQAADALESAKREMAALELALTALQDANTELSARFSPALNRRAGEIFFALTGGKYGDVSLTREFDAAAREAGSILPRRAISLSQGTADQLYLAVRLAICELALPGDDPAPLVLDDALASFDDGRMKLALNLLRELARSRQILLFTCHGRESAALEGERDVSRIPLCQTSCN